MQKISNFSNRSIKKHILSHQVIYARLIHLESKNPELLSNQYIHVNKKDIYKFAVPKLVEDFLNEADFLEN